MNVTRQRAQGRQDLFSKLPAVDGNGVFLFEHHHQFEDIDGIDSQITPHQLVVFADIIRANTFKVEGFNNLRFKFAYEAIHFHAYKFVTGDQLSSASCLPLRLPLQGKGFAVLGALRSGNYIFFTRFGNVFLFSVMNLSAIDIDRLIPHRRPMRLVDDILELGPAQASTLATVSDAWPLIQNGAANPIILIELAAQTAGICIGHRQRQAAEGDIEGMGWLVGVKTADFKVDDLPVGARIITRTVNRFHYDLFTEIEATAHIEGKQVGAIVLQVMQSGSTEPRPPAK